MLRKGKQFLIFAAGNTCHRNILIAFLLLGSIPSKVNIPLVVFDESESNTHKSPLGMDVNKCLVLRKSYVSDVKDNLQQILMSNLGAVLVVTD